MSDITLCKQLGVEIDMIFVIDIGDRYYREYDNGEWSIWEFKDDLLIYNEDRYEDLSGFLGD
jgi:hypothetical protein